MNNPKYLIKKYTESIKNSPNDPNFYFWRGIAKDHLKDYKGAIADFNKAIELDELDVYFSSRGNAKFNLKDYEGALKDYDKAIELYPNKEAYNNRGVVKYKLKNYKGAINDFTISIKLDPYYKEAYVNSLKILNNPEFILLKK